MRVDDRKRAAKYAVAHRVCKVMIYLWMIPVLIFGVCQLYIGVCITFALGFSSIFLTHHFRKRELLLLCTARTTATCVGTDWHSSGRYLHLRPIVTYEVDGKPYTAKLSVSCPKSATGQLYTIYYDPQNPETVRADQQNFLD